MSWSHVRRSVSLVVVAVVLAMAGATLASVPGAPGTLLDPFTQDELDTEWEGDRRFPTDGATSVSAFGRDDVARLGIDSAETHAELFRRTEGIKTLDSDDFGTFVQVDLFMDPDWEDKAVRAGFWVVGDDGTGDRDDLFGIIEFVNNEPCPEADCSNQGNITDHEGFRTWDSGLGAFGEWAGDLDTPFEYGEWVTLGIRLDTDAGEFVYYIDGEEVATADGGEHFIRELFLNSYNYGEDSFPTLSSDSYAAHWHVGLETTTCTVAADGSGHFTSLEDAIDNDGCEIIEVGDGTYDEGPQIVIDRDVTIVGSGVDDTTVITPTADTGTSGDARGWFLIESGDVHISDMRFDGDGFDIWQAFRHKGTGSFDNVVFENILFEGLYHGTALAAFGGVGDVDVFDSTFDNIGRVGVLYFGAGSGGEFAGNTYTGKGVGDQLDYALDISAGAVVDVHDNTVSDNRGVASSDGSTSAAFLVTTFFGPDTTATFEDNTITDNTTGVAVGFDDTDASTATMENNEITGNDNGMVVRGDDAIGNSAATRNAITGNDEGVVIVDPADGGAESESAAPLEEDGPPAPATAEGFTEAASEPFDAECNWWGDFTGPAGEGPGAGDSVSEDALFDPWLTTDDLDAPCPAIPEVPRYGGDDRFDTAATISLNDFPDPAAVDTVFIASAANFPDALAGSAAAGKLGAPLLFANLDSIPQATIDELERLDPDTVVILGGTSVISTAVETALGAFGTTDRLAGVNRFETAVDISQFSFPADGSADQVVVATGEVFADAAAGGSAAVAFGGPLLLTSPDALPASVAAEITRLAPTRIVVLGGTAAVSEAVFDELATLAPTVRLFGADRYETAVAVSAEAFPVALRVYVATGLNFPDAVAGAASAAFNGAPVLLVPGTSVPDVVADEITRLGADVVIILGGPAAVSAGVAATLAALVGA